MRAALWTGVLGAALLGFSAGCGGALAVVAPEPLVVREVRWNPGGADVGRVAAVADSGNEVLVVGDRGAFVLVDGRVTGTDRRATAWRGAAAIPAADGKGTWLAAVDDRGAVFRVKNRAGLEGISDRYGLSETPVLGLANMGGGFVGFALESSRIAIADGRSVVTLVPPTRSSVLVEPRSGGTGATAEPAPGCGANAPPKQTSAARAEHAAKQRQKSGLDFWRAALARGASGGEWQSPDSAIRSDSTGRIPVVLNGAPPFAWEPSDLGGADGASAPAGGGHPLDRIHGSESFTGGGHPSQQDIPRQGSVEWEIQGWRSLAGGGGKIAWIDGDAICLLDPGTRGTVRFELPGVRRIGLDERGGVWAVTNHGLYTGGATGSLGLVYETEDVRAAISGLAISGDRIWFLVGGEVASISALPEPFGAVPKPMRRVEITRGREGRKGGLTGRLFGSASGDVWNLREGVLSRLSVVPAGERARWADTLAPAIGRACVTCHGPTGSSGIDLSTFDAWESRRASVRRRVIEIGDMPPRGAPFTEADRRAIEGSLR